MWWRTRREKDLDDEITFHLARETQLRAERGATAEEAQLGARRAFGSIALAREATRAVWVSTALEQLLQDLRFGCRILTKSPALSATAVLLVALVIGGNTTVFSIAHGILKKPAPGMTADRLVTLNWVNEEGRKDPATSYPNYQDLAAQSSTLRPMLAYHPFARFTLNHESGSYAVKGSHVSSNYFDALGVPVVKGRFFNQQDEAGSAGLVAVISHRAWQDYFQSAEDVVGRPVSLNGHPASIVGVTAPGFRGTTLWSDDIWVPLVSYARASGQQASLQNRASYGVAIAMHARLAPGAPLSQANAELAVLWARLTSAHSELKHLKVMLVPYSAVSGSGTGLDHNGDRLLAILSIVTLITLVIVCANVANLLLARAVIRQREMAMRQALGASRMRIIRLLFAEGLMISSIAVVAAFLFAWWVARGIGAAIAPGPFGPVATLDFTPDRTAAAYSAVLAVVALVAFTVAPAIRTWRLALLPWLKSGEQGVVQGRSRLSRSLAIVQLAFSVLLLTCSGLAYRSLFLMGSADPGFNTRNLLLITVDTTGSAAGAGANTALLDRILRRLRTVPGVQQISYARQPAFPWESGWDGDIVRGVASTAEDVSAELNHVGPDYLQTLGVSVAGREFASHDRARAMRSAVISQNLADALWPGQTPVGRTLLIEVDNDASNVAPLEAEVVGVMPDGFFSGFRRDRPRFVLLSAQQEPAPPGQTTFHIRYTGNLDTVTPAIVRSMREVDARTPIAEMRTMESKVEDALWPIRALAMLLMLFAGGSLLIATIGQYAVVAFNMRRRVRELGLRIALGASSSQLLTMVLGEGFRLTAVGLAIGFALSLATGRILGGILFGITTTDLLTFLGVFLLLSAASLLACYLPARRAARINPMTALRNE